MKNKIYNNLNIENLIKTDWKNQFNENQLKEINFGLKYNLDVSIYAKKCFHSWQMNRIRKVLEKNKSIAIVYAKLIYYLNKINLKLFKKSTL